MTGTRKSVTIVFADIAGYSAIMQEDEAQGIDMLRRFREELEEAVPKFGGEIIQYFGDGCLMSFDEATGAVRCTIELQGAFHGNLSIPVRIGLHHGEALFRDNNAFGDTVNVASRVESIGVPGAVLVSDRLKEQLSQSEFEWKSLGAFEFKNIKKPVEVFALNQEGFIIPKAEVLQGKFKEKKPVNKWIRAAQWLAVYLLASWALVQFFAYLLPAMNVSPHWASMLQWSLWGIVPSLFIFFLNQDRIRRRLLHWREKIILGLNILALATILYFVFGSADLGVLTTEVNFAGIGTGLGSQTIMKEEFRIPIPIFPFESDGDSSENDWLGNGLKQLLIHDLNQDKFVTAISQTDEYLSTVEKISSVRIFYDRFVDGSFQKADNQYIITPEIHQSKNGELISKRSFRGSDLLLILDSASVYIRETLGVSKSHMDAMLDLPLKEFTSSNPQAVWHYMKGYVVGSRLELEKAIQADSSFAVAWLQLARLNLGWNRGKAETRINIEQAFQHRRKLPADKQIEIMAIRHIANGAWEEAEKLVKLRLEIEPTNPEFNEMLSRIYGETQQTKVLLEHAESLFEKDQNENNGMRYLHALYMNDKIAKAERSLKQIILLEPQNPYLLSLLFQAQAYQGKGKEARKTREKILLLEPDREPIISVIDSILHFKESQKALSNAELDAFTGTYISQFDEGVMKFWREGDRLMSFYSHQVAQRCFPIAKDAVSYSTLYNGWYFHFQTNQENEYEVIKTFFNSKKKLRYL
jgi:Flp pilus assembly protein TadD/TolB-like protein